MVRTGLTVMVLLAVTGCGSGASTDSQAAQSTPRQVYLDNLSQLGYTQSTPSQQHAAMEVGRMFCLAKRGGASDTNAENGLRDFGGVSNSELRHDIALSASIPGSLCPQP